MNVYRKNILRQLQFAYIKKELALQDDEIYAFGDSSNDFDMIKAAGLRGDHGAS